MTTEEKLAKASFLLGFAYSGIKSFCVVHQSLVSDRLSELCDKLEKGINELFYSDEVKE